jgi:hypothetical protein
MARKANIEAPLGSRAAETGALSTSHQHDGHLVLRDQAQSLIIVFLEILRV